MSDKLYDWMRRVRDKHVMEGLNRVSAGVDVVYEFGRRTGVREGMDVLLDAYTKFQEDEADKEKEL